MVREGFDCDELQWIVRPGIRYRSFRDWLQRLFRFGALGGISFLANLGITALGHEALGLRPQVAFATSQATVIGLNFCLCRYLVFGASDSVGRQLSLFLISAVGFRSLEYLTFLALYLYVGVPYLAAVVFVLVMWLAIKFVVYDVLIFRRRTEPATAADPPL